MPFFQFDALRKVAKYAITCDVSAADRQPFFEATGLDFRPINENYKPWRNYGRIFRAALIVARVNGKAVPTKIAHLLAEDGVITSDEYFHFFAETFTDPAPCYQEWTPTDRPRFPLLFSLKFLLARANLGAPICTYSEIIEAYERSNYDGDEGQTEFLTLAGKTWTRKPHASGEDEDRQARESIQVLSQISYLSATSQDVTVSLRPEDALEVFQSLEPVKGDQAAESEQEILRLADLYEGAVAGLELEYSKTTLDQAVEAGFVEGTRVEKTHLRLERNAAVRSAFFAQYPTTTCDCCGRDTAAEFPWVDRVLDIHHVLPLCSGTRSSKQGTVLKDLIALCPTCHRAVHKFYAGWLKDEGRKDFIDAQEARAVYDLAKKSRRNA